MKYFLDTEFIEGFHKPLFGKRRHFIDLISIGIFAEDGSNYYAISNEFKYRDADEWVKENVINTISYDRTIERSYPHVVDLLDRKRGMDAVRCIGKSNKQIAEEVLRFFGCWRDQHFYRVGKDIPEIYGYYADYDWVLFCSLFGRMIDLPKGFPMYCKDLKQIMDEKAKQGFYPQKYRPTNLKDSLAMMKELQRFPKQENEHNALADAKWNYELYKFLGTL